MTKTDNFTLVMIDNLKTKYCQKFFDGEISVNGLKQIEDALIEKDEPDNYYQAEAIKQAIQWCEELENEIPNVK